MRFNALGPPLPRARRLAFLGSAGSNPATQGVIGVIAIIVASILLRIIVLHVAGAQLAAEQTRLKNDKAQMPLVSQVQSELNGYQAFASDYGGVRDSGYIVGADLVSLWNAWPNPVKSGSSLVCLRPSEDGKTYLATGVGRTYDSYSASVHSLNEAGFQAVTRDQQAREAHESFTVEISRSATPAPALPAPNTVGANKAVHS